MIEQPVLICTKENEAKEIKITMEPGKKGITFAHISFSFDTPVSPSTAVFKFQTPCIDVYSTWRPRGRALHHIGPNWSKLSIASRLASGAPVLSMIAKNGNNRVTVALSDAKVPCSIGCGVLEESSELEFKIEIFTELMSPMEAFDITVRIDQRDIPFYDALPDVERWWSQDLGLIGAYVPEAAKMPVDSLWYSFHQELSHDAIIEECKASKALGMDTVIIDDGWQTDDNNRGYQFCGDWEPTPNKIPDMKKLVDELHEIGMKVMIWYSVPYVGVHSEAYERFKDMVAIASKDRSVLTLDPRYKEVREYLTNIYVDAVKSWGLDGLKLDFIDAIKLSPESVNKTFADGDTSLENGLELLLKEVTDQLKEINPDILIEFRQSYIGPTIRKYGNMLRVADCPNDPQSNRIGMVDLRLISGNSAIHSDMIMWNKEETNEAAALQLLNVMFSVPQISLRVPEIKDDHKKLVKNYLDFWRKNRDVLLDGKLVIKHPEQCYSFVSAEKDGTEIAVRYLPLLFEITKKNTYHLFNATADETVVLKLDKQLSFCYTVRDCLGNALKQGKAENVELVSLTVPMSGSVELIPC